MRLSRFVGVICVAAIALPSLAAARSATIRLRIGIPEVSFRDDASKPGDVDESLNAYFAEVERTFAPSKLEIIPIHGNYYQIVHWMRDGSLDGAITSSFSAWLLMRDQRLAVQPVAEFSRDSLATPVVTLTRNVEAPQHAAKAIGDCLDAAIKSIDDPSYRQPCEFHFVNHLSTTGFVLPLMFMEQHLAGHVPPEKQPLFWSRVLQWSQFAFSHDVPASNDPTRYVLTFTFETPNHRPPGAEPLDLGTGAVPSLNDALLLVCRREPGARGCVVNGASVPELFDRSAIDDRGTLNPRSVWMAAGAALQTVKTGYRSTTAWNQPQRDAFGKAIEKTFHLDKRKRSGDEHEDPMAALFHRWYELEHYAFTIRELVRILRADQVIRASQTAALVLPGGGVRATYQAAILDKLYGEEIANLGRVRVGAACRDTVDSLSPNLQKKLIIRGISGTSGGALLGYFASKRRAGGGTPLTDLWIHDGAVRTGSLDVFPLVGSLRWLSVVLLLTVFAATASIHLPQLRQAPANRVPFWYTTFLTLVLLAAPFLIWANGREDPAYLPVVEGFAFAAVILTIHFIHSVSRSAATIDHPMRALTIGLVQIACGIIAIFVILAARPAIAVWFGGHSATLLSATWSILSAAVVLLVVLGLRTVAASTGVREDRRELRPYGQAILVLLVLLGLALGAFLIGMWTGHVTPLELTADYWIWVFICSIFAAKTVVIAGRVFPGAPLQKGINLLSAPAGTAPFPYTPAVSLIAWALLGLSVWFVFISPAVYTNAAGHKSFSDAVEIHRNEPQLVPLVVSMTGLGDHVKKYKPYWGDRYAVESRWCGVVTPDEEIGGKLSHNGDADFCNAVFASGSPFPIYPATPVQLERERQAGLFVDGGFAHRVPLEGALLLGAQQILVVENVARPAETPMAAGSTEGRRPGPLMANTGSIFNYLFERSQMPDIQKAHSAMVATIYPDWAPPDPFLMDFRGSVVRALEHEANDDWEKGHRVGRIENWGEPAPGGPR